MQERYSAPQRTESAPLQRPNAGAPAGARGRMALNFGSGFDFRNANAAAPSRGAMPSSNHPNATSTLPTGLATSATGAGMHSGSANMNTHFSARPPLPGPPAPLMAVPSSAVAATTSAAETSKTGAGSASVTTDSSSNNNNNNNNNTRGSSSSSPSSSNSVNGASHTHANDAATSSSSHSVTRSSTGAANTYACGVPDVHVDAAEPTSMRSTASSYQSNHSSNSNTNTTNNTVHKDSAATNKDSTANSAHAAAAGSAGVSAHAHSNMAAHHVMHNRFGEVIHNTHLVAHGHHSSNTNSSHNHNSAHHHHHHHHRALHHQTPLLGADHRSHASSSKMDDAAEEGRTNGSRHNSKHNHEADISEDYKDIFVESRVYTLSFFLKFQHSLSPVPEGILEYATLLWKAMPENINSIPQNSSLRDNLFKGSNVTMPSKIMTDRKLHNEVMGILGKVTEGNLEVMKTELTNLPIRQSTVEEIRDVIHVFFTKSTRPEDSRYTPLYVNLIAHLIATIGAGEAAGRMIRNEVLDQCKETFLNAADEAKAIEDSAAQMSDEEANLVRMQFKARQKANVYFLGQMFISRLVREKVVLSVLDNLLYGEGRRRRVPPDYCIVHFMELLQTCARFLNAEFFEKTMPRYRAVLEDLKQNYPQKRIQFLLLNFLETIDNGWVPLHGRDVKPDPNANANNANANHAHSSITSPLATRSATAAGAVVSNMRFGSPHYSPSSTNMNNNNTHSNHPPNGSHHPPMSSAAAGHSSSRNSSGPSSPMGGGAYGSAAAAARNNNHNNSNNNGAHGMMMMRAGTPEAARPRIPDREEFWRVMDDFFATSEIDEIVKVVMSIPSELLVPYCGQCMGRYIVTYKYSRERTRLGEVFEILVHKNIMPVQAVQDALISHVHQAIAEDLFTDHPRYFAHWAAVIKNGKSVFPNSMHTRLLNLLVEKHTARSIIVTMVSDVHKVIEESSNSNKTEQKDYNPADRFRVLPALLRYTPPMLEPNAATQDDDAVLAEVRLVDVEVACFMTLCESYDERRHAEVMLNVTDALKRSHLHAYPLISAYFTFVRFDVDTLCTTYKEVLKKLLSLRTPASLLEEVYVQWLALECPESCYFAFVKKTLSFLTGSAKATELPEKLRERLRSEYGADKLVTQLERYLRERKD